MLLDHLRRRFAYHGWASALLAHAVTDGARHAAAHRLLVHTFTADRVWLLRLRGEPTEALALWPALPAEGLHALARRNADGYGEYLDGLTSGHPGSDPGQALTRPVAYRNSKGDAYETAIADVLDHVLFHGAYHRGQAAAALRTAGDDPPWTDYIVWVRMMKGEE